MWSSDWPFLAVCAVVLSVERACYVWIARAPQSFRRWCARCVATSREEPIVVVQGLFYAFKALQLTLFVGWCYAYGQGSLSLVDRGVVPVAVGIGVMLVGQALVFSVFYRLRKVGVFFGDRFGYAVPWCRTFPFSVIAHPQYVGAVLSIWGFFVVLRFPHDDWVLLPALETVLYAVGAHLEDRGGTGRGAEPTTASPPVKEPASRENLPDRVPADAGAI